MEPLRRTSAASVLSLLTSSSTLVCCAIPALLVGLGAGAVLSSLISVFPQLVWVSEHKSLVFGTAALMLTLAGYLQWHARMLPCPVDPVLAAACTRARRNSLWVYAASVVVFLIGGFFAFIAPIFL